MTYNQRSLLCIRFSAQVVRHESYFTQSVKMLGWCCTIWNYLVGIVWFDDDWKIAKLPVSKRVDQNLQTSVTTPDRWSDDLRTDNSLLVVWVERVIATVHLFTYATVLSRCHMLWIEAIFSAAYRFKARSLNFAICCVRVVLPGANATGLMNVSNRPGVRMRWMFSLSNNRRNQGKHCTGVKVRSEFITLSGFIQLITKHELLQCWAAAWITTSTDH